MIFNSNLRLSFFGLFLFVLSFSASCSKEDTGPNTDSEETPTDTAAKLAAKKLYEDYYLASKSVAAVTPWTGDETSCDAGNVPSKTKDKILQRLAYYRLAVGLNNRISENITKSEKAQQAALMMHSNNALNHTPPNTWKCYSAAGKEGAGNSLLTMTRNAEAIDSYIRDQGANNGPVGHRRWLLWPRLQEIGIGNTDRANAIWVLGNAGPIPQDNPAFIAWPPEGYVPSQVVYPRWSFSIKDADFTSAKITMRNADGKTIALTIEHLNNQFGDRTIVWAPEDIKTNLDEDFSYTISIKDVDINGTLQNFEYTVILFNINV